MSDIVRPNGAITTNLCSTGICHPLAHCVEGAFRPICICPAGYTGSGVGQAGCVRGAFDPCAPNPCQNGGSCSPNSLGTSFSCTCPPGTMRPLCTISTDPCSHSPCQNGGTCTVVNGGTRYRCACPPKYTGLFCQSEVRACGGVLMGLRGTLRYPPSDNYPHNSRCAWLIKTNVTQVLNITFTRFDVERSQDCHFDWLQVSADDQRNVNASPAVMRYIFHCRFTMADLPPPTWLEGFAEMYYRKGVILYPRTICSIFGLDRTTQRHTKASNCNGRASIQVYPLLKYPSLSAIS